MTAGSLSDELRAAATAALEAERPDLLDKLLEGMIEILRSPATLDDVDQELAE